MKILLTGKNGQVGFELRRSLAILGEVLAVDIEDCDLSNPASIQQLVRDYQPNIIVNPAAYTAVEQAEKDQKMAHAINAIAPEILSKEATRLNALLIHFSTNYVFDGKKIGAYRENDPPNPQSIYGASKLAGEHAVQAHCARHFILRTSWIIGAHGSNFAKTMLRLASEQNELHIVADQTGAPTSAALLADITAHLVRQATQSPANTNTAHGLYHAAASGITSWHEYASYVIERARSAGKPIRVAPHSIQPVTTANYPTAAKRPANSALDTSKLCTTFGIHMPHWKNGVDHILDQIL